jgi:hypothetical protein
MTGKSKRLDVAAGQQAARLTAQPLATLRKELGSLTGDPSRQGAR